MTYPAEVVTLGECMVLVYPTEPVNLIQADTLKFDMAGAESNLSIALARLNHSVRYISRIGKDPFGEFIRTKLLDEGVVLDSFLEDEEAATGLFFREWLEDGERRVYYFRKDSAASRLSMNDIHKHMFAGVRLLHLTGITPALSQTCKEACFQAVEHAREVGAKISFDPNYRAPLWDYDTARATLIPLAEMADFLLLGHEDANAMFGETDDLRILEKASELGPSVIVLKRAERGSITRVGHEIFETKPYPIDVILDPVGAGDGFDAGFIAGWLRGWDFPKAIELGAKIGALAVTTMGDYHGYPSNL